jgi:hypothetical protein
LLGGAIQVAGMVVSNIFFRVRFADNRSTPTIFSRLKK